MIVCEHVNGRAPDVRIAHQRQVDEVLDRAAPAAGAKSARIPARTSVSVGCGDQVDPERGGGTPGRISTARVAADRRVV